MQFGATFKWYSVCALNIYDGDQIYNTNVITRVPPHPSKWKCVYVSPAQLPQSLSCLVYLFLIIFFFIITSKCDSLLLNRSTLTHRHTNTRKACLNAESLLTNITIRPQRRKPTSSFVRCCCCCCYNVVGFGALIGFSVFGDKANVTKSLYTFVSLFLGR